VASQPTLSPSLKVFQFKVQSSKLRVGEDNANPPTPFFVVSPADFCSAPAATTVSVNNQTNCASGAAEGVMVPGAEAVQGGRIEAVGTAQTFGQLHKAASIGAAFRSNTIFVLQSSL
jgi:hypothetical protein